MEENLGDRFSRRRRVAILITLGLLTGLGPFTVDLYLPAFPALKAEYGVGDPQVQATLSATIIGFAVGQLLVGPISDRVGRKLPLLAMNSLHIAASIMVAIAPTLPFLASMRALQGFGAAGGAVVAMAMARDLFSGSKLMRMLARLALINGLAPIIAPLIGSWMVTFMDWRGIFWALAGYGALIVLLVGTLIVETRPPAHRTKGGWSGVSDGYRRVLRDRQFVGAWLMVAFAFAGLFSYVSTSSLLLQEVFGLSAQGFGLVFAICSVGVMVGAQVGNRMGGRLGGVRSLVVSTGIMVAAAAALLVVDAATTTVEPLVPAMFFYTLGFGMTMPPAQMLALEHQRRDSGTAASLMGALNNGLAAVVGPTIGLFALTSALPMAVGMLLCAMLAVAALWLILRPAQGRRMSRV